MDNKQLKEMRKRFEELIEQNRMEREKQLEVLANMKAAEGELLFLHLQIERALQEGGENV